MKPRLKAHILAIGLRNYVDLRDFMFVFSFTANLGPTEDVLLSLSLSKRVPT